jgi:Mg-chelatase subunit ChlD
MVNGPPTLPQRDELFDAAESMASTTRCHLGNARACPDQDLTNRESRAPAQLIARWRRSAARFGPAAPTARRAAPRDFDARATIRTNLKHFDGATRKLLIERALFWSRQRKHNERWQIILLVDQSGSMVSSVIHAAVTAGCLWGLPAMKTHLVAFDTEIVDLTSHVTDPVEALMRVQLGGGTDIGKAVRYAEQLVENPRRTVIACVTDLFEGGSPDPLVRSVKRLVDAGARFLALAALDAQAEPAFDRELGRRLASVGAHVGAMTPGQLVGYLKEVLR